MTEKIINGSTEQVEQMIVRQDKDYKQVIAKTKGINATIVTLDLKDVQVHTNNNTITMVQELEDKPVPVSRSEGVLDDVKDFLLVSSKYGEMIIYKQKNNSVFRLKDVEDVKFILRANRTLSVSFTQNHYTEEE